MKITALLPAHNEEACIGTALDALAAQVLRPDRVITIADNCTDRTADIAAAHGAEVFPTSGNMHKKAGALNQVLEGILPGLSDDDAVFIQDADSFLDPGFLSSASRYLLAGYGAVGGNFRGRDGGGFTGWCQRNEYARYARDNARKSGRVLCITGVGTLFRVSVLRAIYEARKNGLLPDSGGGSIYSYRTLTEDNEITHALRRLGFKFIAPSSVTMSTEPMLTWKDLEKQRLRWKRGALEDLVVYGFNRHTLKGWFLFAVSLLGLLITVVYLGTLAVLPVIGFHPEIPLVAGITAVYMIERAVTVRSRGLRTQLAALTIFPEWIYDIFLQGVQLRAITGAVFRTRTHW